MMMRMILVNTAKSYPTVARLIVSPPPGQSKPVTVENEILDALETVTTGDWPNLSDTFLDDHGDYLLGTCSGLVTVTYRITRYERIGGKLRFFVEPAPELTPLIGQPQPQGPWKRGEARGTRQVVTPTSLPSHYDHGTWKRYLINAALDVLGGTVSQQGPLASHFLQQWDDERATIVPDNVRISVRLDGTIVVDVPPGQNVLVRTS